MASRGESHAFADEDEGYDRPRPRRRFRGSHWRHPSSSQASPPPASQSPLQHSPPQIRPFSISMGDSRFGNFDTSPPRAALISTSRRGTSASLTNGAYEPMALDFADELSKVFNIDEDPKVEELEVSLREKNQRLSMQTNELELLSQRIREAEERLRRVEEEAEEMSAGQPTPPISPAEKPLPPPPPPKESFETDTRQGHQSRNGDMRQD